MWPIGEIKQEVFDKIVAYENSVLVVRGDSEVQGKKIVQKRGRRMSACGKLYPKKKMKKKRRKKSDCFPNFGGGAHILHH